MYPYDINILGLSNIIIIDDDDDDLFINHFCSRWLNYSEGQQ